MNSGREGSLLVVEDDPTIQRLLRAQLTERGWDVTVTSSGADALQRVAESPQPDLVLLDIGIEDVDGLEVCRRLRQWSDVPILLVTAADSPGVKVAALEMGADDYLTKPFHTGELVARMRAVLRRSTRGNNVGVGIAPPTTPSVIRVGPYVVDISRREVRRAEPTAEDETVTVTEVRLTRTEFDLLQELVTHLDRVLSYNHLLRAVWGPNYHDIRVVHVHASHLRRKLEPDVTGPRHLISVPGVGYRFRADSDPES